MLWAEGDIVRYYTLDFTEILIGMAQHDYFRRTASISIRVIFGDHDFVIGPFATGSLGRPSTTVVLSGSCIVFGQN